MKVIFFLARYLPFVDMAIVLKCELRHSVVEIIAEMTADDLKNSSVEDCIWGFRTGDCASAVYPTT